MVGDWVGVGDFIEKIIDSWYIGIFKTYQQIIVIEIWALSKNYRYRKFASDFIW